MAETVKVGASPAPDELDELDEPEEPDELPEELEEPEELDELEELVEVVELDEAVPPPQALNSNSPAKASSSPGSSRPVIFVFRMNLPTYSGLIL